MNREESKRSVIVEYTTRKKIVKLFQRMKQELRKI